MASIISEWGWVSSKWMQPYANGSSTAGQSLRGNVTMVTRGGSVASAEYNVAGNVVQALDANFHLSTTEYAVPNNYGSSYAFPNSITNALGHQTQMTWDLNSGKPVTITDPNLQMTIADYHSVADQTKIDPLYRLTKVTRPDQGTTTYAYSDSTNTVTTTAALTGLQPNTSPPTDGYCPANLQKVDDLIFDGLGRTLSQISHEPSGLVTVQTNYDGIGRAYRVSDPYVSGLPPWTTTTYDGLSRVQQVEIESDHAITGFAYPGAQVSRTAPNSHITTSSSDAVGGRRPNRS